MTFASDAITVDASALLAVLYGEPDANVYLSKVMAAPKVRISPVNWWEVQAHMLARYGRAGEEKSAAWMRSAGIVVEPVTLTQAQIAVEAFSRYRGRPARLNMGDCFAYALARDMGSALLYKGNDFSATDVRAA